MKNQYVIYKKIHYILIAVMMMGIAGMFSPAALAAEDEIDPPTVTLDQLIPVYYDVGGSGTNADDLRHPMVSGTTENNKNYVASADPNAGISWDPATATLTLDNYNCGPIYLSNWAKGTKHDAMLPIKIKLIGDNTISASNITYSFWATYLDVTFEGNGSLTIQKPTTNNNKRYIRVNGNLTIDGPDINITTTGDTLEILSCDIHTYKDGALKTVYDAGGNFTLKSGTFFFEKRLTIWETTNIIKASGDINLMGGDILLTDQQLSTNKVIDGTNGALILTDGDINITGTRVITYFDEGLRNLQLFAEHYDYLENTSSKPVLPENAPVYELTSLDVSDYASKFVLNPASPIYNGTELKPEVLIDELKESVHYSYKYDGDLINAGTAKVIITGIGSFSGEIELNYTISPKNVADLNITLDTDEYIYDGSAKTPSVTITGLNKDSDYDISYENNKEAGTNAAVIITGKGNYTGTVRKYFKIVNPSKPNDDQSSGKGNNGSSTSSESNIDESDMNPDGGVTADGISYGPARGKTIKNKTFKFKITKRAVGKTEGTVSIIGFTKKSHKKTTKKLTVPASVTIGGFTYKVTAIAASSFKSCKKIKTAVIGKNVISIGKNAFSGCKKLKKITIKSNNLKSIGKNAIKGINKKASIKVPKKKLSSYKKLFKSKTGYKKTMKIKK